MKENLPIFFEPWWLNAVCARGLWKLCTVKDKVGNLLGILPYFQTSFLGFKFIRTPPFTPYLGIWLNRSQLPSRRVDRNGTEQRLIEELVAQLPEVIYYHQIHPLTLDNWLPFYWKGYRQTTRYTYLFEELNLSLILAGLKCDVRNKLNKARRHGLVVRQENNLDKLLGLLRKTFDRQRLAMTHDIAILRKLHDEIQLRKQGAIYFAEDTTGQTHAGLYLIWDKESAYCWQLGADTDLRKSGAVQLLLWHSIEEASKIVKSYNFEGSLLPHIEPVFRAFGAERKPVFQIFKYQNRWVEALSVLLRTR